MSNSDKPKFAFGGGSLSSKEDNVQPPVEEMSVETPQTYVPRKVDEDSELNKPYTDRRTVTIGLVKNYSLYRKANDKVLPKKRDFIGSSIHSSSVLSSNKVEIETYFPSILGVAPNDSSFMTRVKQYLNNIQIPVDELGKQFDISFVYDRKADYIAILKKEQDIEDEYNSVGKNNLRLLKEALKEKIYKLNLLESTKCTLGRPINVTDYLMYRHCLLYNDVAKDMALINSDSSLRFYFKDDKKEQEKLKKLRMEINKAKQNYVACIADEQLFEAIYIQYCIQTGRPIITSLAEDMLVKEANLDKFSTDEPLKFNKIYNNKDVKLMGTIEKLIARNELIRIPHSQNITTAEGQFIGANVGEVVAWFKNPENTSAVNAYYSRLNNI